MDENGNNINSEDMDDVVEEIVDTVEEVAVTVEDTVEEVKVAENQPIESVEQVIVEEVDALPGDVQASYSNSGGKEPANGLAVGSMVTGILALVFSCCVAPLALILAIVAIVLAVITFNKNKGVATFNGKGMAIAGLALGIISGLLSLMMVGLLAFGMMGSLTESIGDYY